MALSSPHDRSRRRATRRGLSLLGLAVALGLLAPLARLLGVAAGPLFSFERAAASAVSPIADYFAGKAALAEENRALRESVDRLHVAALERDALRAERDALRAELNVPDRSGASVVAEILLRPPQVAFDSLLVGAGSSDGVRAGDTVLAQGVPIGVVAEASASQSVASLFSAPGSRLAVTVGGVAAEAVGQGNGRYSVEVPAALAAATGTPVLSVAHRGAAVGYVAAAAPGEGESTVELHVALPINLAAARYVSVLPGVREE